jgi:hypothetical protein
MPSSGLTNLVDTIAKAQGVQPAWVKAIISQESGWNSYALRYEVNYRWLHQPEIYAKHPLISISTEIISQKMSWGLGQIMGALAREQGHPGLMPELLKPEVNIQHICTRIKTLRNISTEVLDIFAMYNGGPGAVKKTLGKYSNQAYVDSASSYLQKFQLS